MVNVNIIEGKSAEEKYEAIKEDYINSPLSCRKLQIKHDVSTTAWDKMIKQIKEETGFSRRPGGKRSR